MGRQGGRFPRVSSRTSVTSLSSPVSMQNEALADDVTPGAEKGACQDSPSPSEITDTASPPELTHHTPRNTDILRTRLTHARSQSRRGKGLMETSVMKKCHTFCLRCLSCAMRVYWRFGYNVTQWKVVHTMYTQFKSL